MLGIKRITGAAGSAPEGEPGSWVSDAAREKFMAAYGGVTARRGEPVNGDTRSEGTPVFRYAREISSRILDVPLRVESVCLTKHSRSDHLTPIKT